MNIHYVSIGQNNRYAGKFAIQGRFGLQDGIPFPASRMFKKVLHRCETFWQFSLSLCAAGLPIKQSGFCSSLKARRSLLLALVTRCRKLGALGTTCRNMWTCFLHNKIYVCACVCVDDLKMLLVSVSEKSATFTVPLAPHVSISLRAYYKEKTRLTLSSDEMYDMFR